jgi:hypothetical protein
MSSEGETCFGSNYDGQNHVDMLFGMKYSEQTRNLSLKSE